MPAAFRTPEEYLTSERRSEVKSEYFDGRVFALSGASRLHNLIVANLLIEIGRQLKGRPCEVYPSDMRLRVVDTGSYMYPVVSVVCGTPQFEDEHLDTLLNPTLLIEVLSPTTERHDRGRKAEQYRRIESVSEYLLVAQTEPRIEQYRRRGEREWLLTENSGLDETVALSIACVVSLRDVYDRVF